MKVDIEELITKIADELRTVGGTGQRLFVEEIANMVLSESVTYLSDGIFIIHDG